MKSEKEGINRRWTRTILSVKEYSPLDVRGLCSLVVRTMLAGRKDYAHWSKGLCSLVERTIFVFKPSWNRIGEPYSCGCQSVLLRPSKRNLAGVETALCRRRKGTFVKTRKSNSPRTVKRAGGAGNRLFNILLRRSRSHDRR